MSVDSRGSRLPCMTASALRWLYSDGFSDNRPRIDALVGETEKATELLQERRFALISAAVTGQIDVRGAAFAGHSDLGGSAAKEAWCRPASAASGHGKTCHILGALPRLACQNATTWMARVGDSTSR